METDWGQARGRVPERARDPLHREIASPRDDPLPQALMHSPPTGTPSSYGKTFAKRARAGSLGSRSRAGSRDVSGTALSTRLRRGARAGGDGVGCLGARGGWMAAPRAAQFRFLGRGGAEADVEAREALHVPRGLRRRRGCRGTAAGRPRDGHLQILTQL